MATKQDYEIYNLIGSGLSKAEVGRRFGVSPRTVGRAVERVRVFEASEPEQATDEPIAAESTFNYSVIVTEELLTIVKTRGNSVTLNSDDPRFEEFFDEIMLSRGSQEVLKKLYDELSVPAKLESCAAFGVEFNPTTCQVTFKGEPISEGLGNRLVEAAKTRDVKAFGALAAFTAKLNENPSFRAVNELYDFLVASDINITQDGMVECFKRVREDYFDVYSGKFDNSPGNVVSVPRNKVDEDSEVICSYGLHVCSKAYLAHYSGSRVVKVLVNPKDFVAIPKDYYSIDSESGQVKAKARVCAYVVTEDVTSQLLYDIS